jgi:hypothetical protein
LTGADEQHGVTVDEGLMGDVADCHVSIGAQF